MSKVISKHRSSDGWIFERLEYEQVRIKVARCEGLDHPIITVENEIPDKDWILIVSAMSQFGIDQRICRIIDTIHMNK